MEAVQFLFLGTVLRMSGMERLITSQDMAMAVLVLRAFPELPLLAPPSIITFMPNTRFGQNTSRL